MAGWARLTKGYKYHAGEDAITGQEQFAVEASGASSLPTVGVTPMKDPAGNTIASCLCRSIDSDYPEGDDATRSVICQFSTMSISQPGGDSPGSSNPESRKLNTTVECYSKDFTDWKWETGNASAGKQTVRIRAFKGSLSIPRVFEDEGNETHLSADEKWKAFLVKVIATAGKINDNWFEGWRTGSVLFLGISGGTRYDNEGKKSWAVDMNFEIKALPDTAFGTLPPEQRNDDWLRMLRKDGTAGAPEWDKLKDLLGQYLYQHADFQTLFA